MKIFPRLLLLCFLILFSGSVFAQAAYFMVYDTKGQVTATREYLDILGSPYLSPDWLTGTFTLGNGKVYKDINIKYDQVKDRMLVKGNNDEMITLIEPVRNFAVDFPMEGEVVNRYFRRGYTEIPSTTDAYYFEVLEDGKTQLLKRSAKIIQENKEYNSATSTKSFEEIIKYYIYKDGKGVIVRKDKKAIFAALGDKQTELDAFIKENKLNLKTDADLSKLITYYNTL